MLNFLNFVLKYNMRKENVSKWFAEYGESEDTRAKSPEVEEQQSLRKGPASTSVPPPPCPMTHSPDLCEQGTDLPGFVLCVHQRIRHLFLCAWSLPLKTMFRLFQHTVGCCCRLLTLIAV